MAATTEEVAAAVEVVEDTVQKCTAGDLLQGAAEDTTVMAAAVINADGGGS